ncbi:uncharacterized protein FTJAE_12492 [Fusarium tjaetaba]|uniref:Uncharacterized protein n=1 Tax=Fusarium tjaetaba TaxID=1567544 RepID=A0A8H5QNI2_9HYPO|nr:uncharacterized protein FTJAE_12492 [Fusarium tjaetaba]KAF5617833.1 hypothetical protein FTJAE_12492 [Fusarium tjaetaba]
MARPHLVTLPYEVRDIIFQEYFRVKGGYVFSNESERLTTAGGQPIDFSLMYTCRSIANDTKHLPFEVNNISFSTLFSPDLRAWAGRHQFLSQFIPILKADLICLLQGPTMSPELEEALEEKFPHLMPYFKNGLEDAYRRRLRRDPTVRNGCAFRYWKESRHTSEIIKDLGDVEVRAYGKNTSMAREAIAFSLRFLGERRYFELARLLNEAFPDWKGSNNPQYLMDLTLDPWDIPSKAVLTRIGSLLRDDAVWGRIKDWHEGVQANYRFSATAVAIRFFRQLSREQMRHLRGITLIEDEYAVCSPSTHANGLIKFCKDNPKLRIQRHLKLRRRIPAVIHPCWYMAGYSSIIKPRSERNLYDGEYIRPLLAIDGIGTWLEEAITLPDAGMPRNSYTLCFDEEPDKAYFSNIFQNTLLRIHALILASQQLLRMRPDQFDMWFSLPYQRWQSGHFSKAVKYLIDHHSDSIDSFPLICSNFHPGQPFDVRSFIQERLEWTTHEWLDDQMIKSFRLKQCASTFGSWNDNLESFYEFENPREFPPSENMIES